VLLVSFALCVPVAWLWTLGRSDRAIPWAMAWLTLFSILAGQAEVLVFGNSETGLVGIARIVSALLIGVGLLAGALDERVEASVRFRRSTAAAGALALLFVVAQVAQNFFSAEYGLLSGGIIAGTFLFAASPIQKRIERMGERKPGANASIAAVSPGANDEAYRHAVRFALRDRQLEPAEELALADLAERLGVGARRATEIRLEVQAERKGAR
jgi:hypothetical protein